MNLVKHYIMTYGLKIYLDIKSIKAIDTSGMYKVYDRWPEIAKEQYDAEFESVSDNTPEHIVFAGMGGSGAIGDLFSSILSKTGIHVDVVKGYMLPKTADQNSMIVCTSISGDTAETLSVLKQAKDAKCNVIGFSDGGKLEELCNDKEYHKVPSYHSPRASFTSFLYSMLKVLGPVLSIDSSDISESITKMKETRNNIYSDNLSENNPAVNLASSLPKIPVIYYPFGLETVAVRFKNSLQENCKMHAISEDVIEACHNGIVSWNNDSDLGPIIIRGQDDHLKTQERWNILKEFFEKKNIRYNEVRSASGNIITKLINLVYLLDYSTIYKAVMDGVDPTPVEAIKYIKDRL